MTLAESTPLREKLGRIQNAVFVVGIVVFAACFIELFTDRDVFFRSYLWACLYWAGLAIGCLGVNLMHNVVGGKWGVPIKRILEAGTKTLPWLALLLLPALFFGLHSLYIWSLPSALLDKNIQAKAAYLNPTFFMLRAFGYFIILVLFALRLNRLSDEQDRTGDQETRNRMRMFSAPALLAFTFIVTFAFFDWVMSLEPHWYSTIYGAIFACGQILEALSFAAIVLALVYQTPPFRGVVKTSHFWDLGNMMLCFTMLWAYCGFSQFLIIWSGNLPQEIIWYVRRFSGGWGAIAFIIGVFHFCVPFFLLLMRFMKKDPKWLMRLAIYMLVVRLLDTLWFVLPAFYQRGMVIHWTDFAAVIGIGGIWLGLFLMYFKARPLLPLHDARLPLLAVEEHA